MVPQGWSYGRAHGQYGTGNRSKLVWILWEIGFFSKEKVSLVATGIRCIGMGLQRK